MTEASDKKIIHSYMNVIKKMKNGHRKYDYKTSYSHVKIEIRPKVESRGNTI